MLSLLHFPSSWTLIFTSYFLFTEVLVSPLSDSDKFKKNSVVDGSVIVRDIVMTSNKTIHNNVNVQ